MGFLLWLEHRSLTPAAFSDASVLHKIKDPRRALPGEDVMLRYSHVRVRENGRQWSLGGRARRCEGVRRAQSLEGTGSQATGLLERRTLALNEKPGVNQTKGHLA